MKVTVLGLGYVGCVTAAVLAREGHHVSGIDTNPSKVDMLATGQCPVIEPGLPELVRRGRLTGRLTATCDAGRALAEAEVIVICVGTPSAAHGGLDGSAVQRVATEIGTGIAPRSGYPVIVLRSTVLPDTVDDVLVPHLERASGKRLGEGFGVVVNPEFLREGSAIADFDEPQFTLIGTDEPRSAAVIEHLYSFLRAPVVVTSRRTANLVKYACNAFHALKVAFANEIGAVSSAAGVEARDVMQIFCLDRKLNLSGAYLRPGMPFGGSCLPKDLRAILHYGRRHDVALPLLDAVLESNRVQTEACIARILAHGRARVGICGMAFKAGTDDLRESPTVTIVETLLGKGFPVAIYDSRVSLAHLIGANREYVAHHLPHVASLIRPSLGEVIAGADILVIGNGDQEFRNIPQLMRPEQTLIDLVGIAAPVAADTGRHRSIG
jgi:GDP-mannose 6-dehydrogenase